MSRQETPEGDILPGVDQKLITCFRVPFQGVVVHFPKIVLPVYPGVIDLGDREKLREAVKAITTEKSLLAGIEQAKREQETVLKNLY